MILNKTTFAFIAILFNSLLFSQTDTAAIDLVDFNATAVYGPGSGVSVHINPTGIFEFEDAPASDNTFVLEMSESGGAFTNPSVISTVNGFFTTTINGIIPAGTVAGNYRLRVKATKGMLADGSTFGDVFSVESAVFVVNSTTSEGVLFHSLISPNSTQFDCTVEGDFDTDPMFGSLSISSSDVSGNIFTVSQINRLKIFNKVSGVTYKFRRINTTNFSIVDFAPVSGNFHQIASDVPLGAYNYEMEAVAGGVSSIYTAVFVFHKSTTGLANESSEIICVRNDVEFNIDESNDGIGLNYPGSYYTFDFGDGTPIELFTHAELLYNNALSHTYTAASCSEENSKFTVVKSQFNKYNQSVDPDCVYQSIGFGATKNVNVSLAPVALFEAEGGVVELCENQPISIINLTTLGQFGNVGTCEDDANFFWTITDPNGNTIAPYFLTNSIEEDPDNWMVDTNIDGLLDIFIPATQVIAGCWTFRLEYLNQDLCLTKSVYPEENLPAYVVNVQAIPVADFDFLDASGTVIEEICFGETVTFSDTSSLQGLDCQVPTYEWTIFPDTGYTYVFPFTDSSQSPDVIFNDSGVYDVTQTITNVCGTSEPMTKQITILGDPTVEFPTPFFAACQGLAGQTADGFILDFLNNTPISPVYSESPFEPTTFTWTITGPGVTATDYIFLGGTDATSEFPVIKFLSYNTYTITVEVDGNCANSNSDTLTFLYEQTPVITNTDTQQDICTGDTTQLVQFTSDTDPATVYIIVINQNPNISGYDTALNSGGTIPVMTLINSTNVPQDLVYSVAPVVNNCQGGAVNFTFTVNPEPVIPNQTDEICSGETFTVDPVNNPPATIVPAGTTYTWTVVDNPDVFGESGEDSPQTTISQNLKNETNVPQLVNYTVTPTSGAEGGCVGEPFTVTVQVNPKPTLDDVDIPAICSGETFDLIPVNAGGINGIDIIPANTTYTWTVLDANNLVTGHSDETTGQTSISQNINKYFKCSSNLGLYSNTNFRSCRVLYWRYFYSDHYGESCASDSKSNG